MKIAVFSDIHGNLTGLQATLGDIRKHRPDVTICLGDLVGYGPFPNEVCETVQSLGIPVIQGNYDQGVGEKIDDCGCAYKSEEEKALGKISIQWTNEAINNVNRNFLKGLLPRHEITVDSFRMLFVHGSPRRINEYLFPDRPDKNLLHVMKEEEAKVLVCGHTHIPFFRMVEDTYFLNDGSCGRPKDGDWRAAWALISVEKQTIEAKICRVEYDLPSLEKSYQHSRLPFKYFEDLKQSSS